MNNATISVISTTLNCNLVTGLVLQHAQSESMESFFTTIVQITNMDLKLIAIPVAIIIAIAALGSISQLPQNDVVTIPQKESQTEAEIHKLVNSLRVEHGLEKLLYDRDLGKIAKAHSNQMLRGGYFEHNTPSGVTPTDMAKAGGYECVLGILPDEYNKDIGENLFKIDSPDSLLSEQPKVIAQDAVDSWMLSPESKGVMFDEYSEKSGVGVVIGQNKILVTHDFC